MIERQNPTMKPTRSFASDNNSGVHPKIFEALSRVNKGHHTGYGDDPFTAQARALFKILFGESARLFFVYGGTGANVLALTALARPFESVICAQGAHINVDECGAPERFSGCKLIDIPTPDGKLGPDLIRPYLTGFDFEHHSQPKVISIAQPTELGTLYTLDELRALHALADEYHLYLHMDGARISNAAVALDCTFADITEAAGVDAISFGGNKNGLMFGEALVFLNPNIANSFKYLRKQGMQLHSKMRYIAAQFNEMYGTDLWRHNAHNANMVAKYLALQLQKISKIKITQKVETNGVFAIVPPEIIKPLQKKYFFYVWDEVLNEVRWMASYDSEKADVDEFVAEIKQLLK